ncbi:MAG: RNA polymerase sigma factor [Wenzhouxiangellaceae bacterium]
MKRRFEQLVDQHGRRLLQIARLLLGRVDEAEDVVQDTLVKLWSHLRQLDEGSEIPWLVTCTRNACLDRLRGRSRARLALLRVADEHQISGSRGDFDCGPAELLLREQRQRVLREGIASLPEPGRSLLILRDIQDLDVATVARTLELSENQVKVYTFRARRALRHHLEEQSHEQVA